MTYYAIHKGHNPGIYMNWDSAKKEIDGFKGAIHKSFKHIKDAENFVIYGEYEHVQPPPVKSVIQPPPVESVIQPPPVKSQIKEDSEILKYLNLYKTHNDYNISSPTIRIYTDGSTINNGSKNAYGGYGVFIPESLHIKEKLISRKLIDGKITNGVAELKALHKAFEEVLALDNCNSNSNIGIATIAIYYDSTYAVQVITGETKARTNIELVNKCKELLRQIKLNNSITFNHVYSHTGHKDLHSIGNEIADKLASL